MVCLYIVFLRLDECLLAYTRVTIHIISILQDLRFSQFSKGPNAKPSKQSTATPFHSLGNIRSHLSQSVFSAKHGKFHKCTKAANLTSHLAQREHKFHVLSSQEPLQKEVEPWEHVEVSRQLWPERSTQLLTGLLAFKQITKDHPAQFLFLPDPDPQGSLRGLWSFYSSWFVGEFQLEVSQGIQEHCAKANGAVWMEREGGQCYGCWGIS